MRQRIKYVVCNAFSLSMLNREMQRAPASRWDHNNDYRRCPVPITLEEIHEQWIKLEGMGAEVVVESAVGHADTAVILSSMLGKTLDVNRVSIKLDDPNVKLIVGQYTGPRLPEGTKVLPEGASIEWWLI